MDEYEELLKLHLARLSRERLQRMAALITSELRKRAGLPAGGDLLGGEKKDDTPQCPVNDIVEAYHVGLPMLPRVRIMSATRRLAIRRFWAWVLSSKKSDGTRRAETAQQAIEWIDSYFLRAAENDFITGRNQRNSGAHAGWKADIDYLLTERGRTQVIEKTAVTA